VPPLAAESFPARKEVLKSMALLEMPRNRLPSSYGVSVVGHEVKFNAERDLWYADVEIAGLVDRFSFLRLGLVRFQPFSAQGCHLSRVELPDPVQIPPRRTLIATTHGAARESLVVTVRGPRLQHTHLTVEHHRRVLDQTLTPPLEITEPSGPARTLTPLAPASADLADTATLQAALPPPPAPQAVPAEYLAGRIVVREHQRGRNILTGASESRVVYFETFERNLPPGPILSAGTATVVAGGPVTVTWRGATGSVSSDWIGLFEPGAPNQAHKTYQYTDGTAAGSRVFAMNVPPGTYELRFLPNDGYAHTATSIPVTVTAS